MPINIYHGSPDSLMKLTPLEGTENEKPILLASLDPEQAIEKALKTLLERTHILDSFSIHDNSLEITLNWKSPLLTRSMLEKKIVFLYTCTHDSKSSWVRIAKDGQLTPCFYSENPVTPTDKARILMYIWLRGKKIKIRHSRA